MRTSGAWGRANESAEVAHVLAARDRLLGLAAEAQAAPPAAVVAVAGTGTFSRRRRTRGGWGANSRRAAAEVVEAELPPGVLGVECTSEE